MSTVNYNDTTPAAPAGMNNIKWQSDASGNISAYDPGGAWQLWTPTVVSSGSMVISALSIITARYIKLGAIIHFFCAMTFNIGGTLGTDITFSAPFPYGGGGNPSTCASNGNQPTALQEVMIASVSTAGILVRRNNITNWAAGATAGVNIAGTYQCSP